MRCDFQFQWNVSDSGRPVLYGKQPPEPKVTFTLSRGGQREDPEGPILGGRTREGRAELGLKERRESTGDQRGETLMRATDPEDTKEKRLRP